MNQNSNINTALPLDPKYAATHNSPQNKNIFGKVLKVIMDRAGAAIALLLLSPVFLYLYIQVGKDKGPVFFGHTRIGQNGSSFKCWKFRSMVPNAQEILHELLNNDAVAKAEYEKDFKLKDDPRITKIGHFLRKSSLDEIPQLYNVLCGEMSLVGPRPIVEAEKKYYADDFAYYTAVKPGITGLWQVSGRSDTGYEQRVALDKLYVREWSVWKDIVILFKTVYVVATGKGAY